MELKWNLKYLMKNVNYCEGSHLKKAAQSSGSRRKPLAGQGYSLGATELVISVTVKGSACNRNSNYSVFIISKKYERYRQWHQSHQSHQ